MLYGKWRPRGFEEVVGQDHIITTLRNALATGQVAHAYLFSGPRGTGKTTTARILARALNCENLVGGEPCNQCPPCEAILRGAALDLIEMDAASNRGIEDVRELRDKIGFAPSDLKKKVYLLDEAHMLTSQAWNGLLKTIEEPPPHAVFIFATTEAHQVPATIVSRCQRYDFHRIPNDALIPRLETICKAEGFAVPYEGLQAIAIQSRGGARDAITLLEQVVARYGQSPSTDEVLASLGLVQDERSRKLAAAVIADDLGEAIALAREVADDGVDMGRFTRATVDVLRDVLLQSLRGLNPGSPNASLAATVSKEQAPAIATSIAELAKADFRLDPASPVPLEVACASALLMPVTPQSAPTATVSREAVGASGRERPAGSRGNPPEIAADTPLSEEERFMKQLASRCRMVSAPAGALLNGSCEVVSLSEEKFVLGFYFPVHMGRILNEFKGLVEAQAAEILGRPIQLEAEQVERNGRPQRKAPRGGHLVEAARAIGATPIGKERD